MCVYFSDPVCSGETGGNAAYLCKVSKSRAMVPSKGPLKVVWYPQMEQKVCLNMVKKDQLCAIALKKRN